MNRKGAYHLFFFIFEIINKAIEIKHKRTTTTRTTTTT
jgi:hypothetical protein